MTVGRIEPVLTLRAADDKGTGELLTELLREIRHVRKAGGAALVHPLRDLAGTVLRQRERLQCFLKLLRGQSKNILQRLILSYPSDLSSSCGR